MLETIVRNAKNISSRHGMTSSRANPNKTKTMEPGESVMRQISFSEVTSILISIKNAKSNTLKIDVWRRYLNKFQERHKNQVG